MKSEIEALEKNLAELKRKHEQQERIDYENSTHKSFLEGDIVKKGDQVGIVGWTENKAIKLPEQAGYMGVSLITGSRGFVAPCRRDEWELVDDPYYTNNYEIKTEFTGLEIEDLLYYIGPDNFYPNDAKSKLIALLKAARTLEIDSKTLK
jgi:hypothetical protein